MLILDFSQYIAEWSLGEKQQRLGQYLINKMQPPVTDPEIFYERDAQTAATKFYMKYVHPGVG